MKSRAFLMAIGLFTLSLVALINKIAVAGDDPRTMQSSFQASFRFGQEARGTAYRSDWFVKSSFTDTIGFYTTYFTMPTQAITRVIGEDGYSSYISTDLSYPRYPRGFRLVSAGNGWRTPRPLVETTWISDCLPGPELLIELRELNPSGYPSSQVTVRNTTLQRLSLYSLSGRLYNTTLTPGEWLSISSNEQSNEITIKVADQGPEKNCAIVLWTLPPPNPAATVTPTIAPSQTLTVSLTPGWELFSMPQSRYSYSASSLISDMADQGITITKIVRWQNGSWDTYLAGFPANDFPVETRRAYFLQVAHPGLWKVER